MPTDRCIRILLALNSPADTDTIRSILTDWDQRAEITAVPSLAAARRQMEQHPPDLVLADLDLDDGGGFQLLPAEREQTTVPILFLTRSGNEQEAVRARRAGALDYLVMSSELSVQLPHAVERALREWEHIARRREAEENLRRSERSYRLLFENMTAGFALNEMIYDREGLPSDYRFLEVNPAFERLTGLRAADLVGRTVRQVLPRTEEYWIQTFGAVARSGEPVSYLNFSRELGRYYDTWVFSPEKDRFAVIFSDVTDRRQSEEALRRSEERWRSVFNTAAAGMVIISSAGVLTEVNPWFCNMLGYHQDELVGRSVEEITHPDDREFSAHHYRAVADGDAAPFHYQKRYLCKDGRVIWGHASVACVMDEQRRPAYCIGLVQDITERVEKEEGLRRANRELDAFVHTVSHDLRAPLTAITGYADILNTFHRDQLLGECGSYLDQIIRQGNIMMELLEDLLALARVGHLQRPDDPVDVGSLLEEVRMGLGYQLLASEMVVQSGELPAARIPATLLRQIFYNLISNAIRYAGPGGIIEVDGKRLGSLVRYAVRDHGPGLPEAERSRIFDLFYRASQKGSIKGTGIGLATVQKIAQLYGGQAWVDATPGGGCTFLVEMGDDLDQEKMAPPPCRPA